MRLKLLLHTKYDEITVIGKSLSECAKQYLLKLCYNILQHTVLYMCISAYCLES